MARFFTADEHYGHTNILRYCDRPFGSVREMDEEIVKRHNMLVEKNDEVYHLGDMSMWHKGEFPYLRQKMQQLNGIHHLILGSHDAFSPHAYLSAGFDSVHTSLYLWFQAWGRVFLAHDPCLFQFSKAEQMICGHVHNLYQVNPTMRIVNVGVDVWCYAPVTEDEIMTRFGGVA